MLIGNGTANQPYQIKIQADLQEINKNLSAHYLLTEDITLSEEFEPIANQFEPFKGVFDGDNHTVKGLCIKTKTQYAGLFTYNIGTIKNLQIENANIHATAYIGAIAGYNDGIIENCKGSGIIEGTSIIGGIAGFSDKNSVEKDNSSSCEIKKTVSYCEEDKPIIQIFVALNGSNENDGSIDKPFKTINAAKNRVRQLIKDGTQGDIAVFIRNGSYYIEETILLSKEDCFDKDNHVIYTGYKDEKVKLTGGRRITGWEHHTGSIKKAYVGKEINCKYLSIDGKLKTPAKTAEWDKLRFDLTNVYAYYSHGWFSEILKVTEVKGKDIKTLVPKSAFSHDPNYLMGAEEFIKEDGDWALGNDGYIYCKNADEHDIIIPMVKDIFYLNGAQNITIKGLRLCVTDRAENFTAQGGRGKEGFDDYDNTHAAIYLKDASNCTICQNTIKNCALNGISIQGSSTNNLVFENKICDIGFAGIHCQGNWIDSKEYNNNHHCIKNNEISNVGLFAVNGAGIYILGSGHNHICNNLIHDTPRYGISIKGARYGCWQSDCGRNLNNEISFDEHFDYIHSRNNLIEANHIYNAGKNSLDGGGVEAWSPGKYNVIDYNFVYDFYNGIPTTNWKGHGIFLDDATHYTTVTNNIVYESNKQGADASTFMKSIEVYIRNNIFDVTNTHQGAANISPYLDPCGNQTFTNNIVYADPKGGIGEDGQFIENGSLDRRIYTYDISAAKGQTEPPIKYLDKNIYYNTKGELIVSRDNSNPSNDIKWRDFIKETGFDKESINKDPLFVDAGNRNYSLSPNSPALKLGFKNIDMSRMGVQV